MLRLVAAARLGDRGAVGEALVEMARSPGRTRRARCATAEPALEGESPDPGGGTRAAGRAGRRGRGRAPRLADGARRRPSRRCCRDLPLAAGGAWPEGRPDTRRARARRVRRPVRRRAGSRGGAGRRAARRAGNGAGDLRRRHRQRSRPARGLDRHPARGARGRRRGGRGARAGAAGRRWSAIRRGGGAARRRRPAAYERAGRVDDAITALAKCVELRPNDSTAYMRAYQLLRADLDAPGTGGAVRRAPVAPAGRGDADAGRRAWRCCSSAASTACSGSPTARRRSRTSRRS